jgi:alpha-galactosidase
MNALNLKEAIAFRNEKGAVCVDRLFGLGCNDDQAPVRARGIGTLSTSLGLFDSPSWELAGHEATETEAQWVWKVAGGSLRLESRWQVCPDTGVFSRRDRLTNTSQAPVTLYRCLPRLAFVPGHYEVYAQDSRWSNENQGAWVPLHTGSVVLSSEWGRSSDGGTPYACLRNKDSGRGVVLHVIPHGNWVIRISARTGGNRLPYAVVELGLSDADLRLDLAAGEARDLPEILVQDLPDADPRQAAPALHRYINARLRPLDKPELPLIYNTWMDRMSRLNVAHLREELAAARDIGCEVFVVDAGWYGSDDAIWARVVGDWREKQKTAFGGRMKEFADEVRAAGLQFGLWMEPERVVEHAPIRSAHPEWFFPGLPRFNLEIPAAREYIRSEIVRLIETYGIRWFKLDYNVSLGYDATGGELSRYFDVWYAMMDSLRRDYPGTVFENCSSGAMRQDLSTLFHYDTQFISDSANPLDNIRIAEGAILRLPPGRILRWAVMRGITTPLPELGKTPDEWPGRLVAPGGATWQVVESVDVDFLMAVCLPGTLGFSGDLLAVPAAQRDRIRWYVTFFKQWRRFLQTTVGHLLTPVRSIGDRRSETAFQFQAADSDTSLLFFYNFPEDGLERRWYRLHGLQAGRRYTIRKVGPDGTVETTATGEVLMKAGLEIMTPYQEHARWTSQILVIEPVM